MFCFLQQQGFDWPFSLQSGFLIWCIQCDAQMKCTDWSNLLTPWRDALQGTLAYQCRGWWRSSGTHQSEPHWFATRHYQSWASISSWKASPKPGHGSSLCLSESAWKTCHTCVFYYGQKGKKSDKTWDICFPLEQLELLEIQRCCTLLSCQWEWKTLVIVINNHITNY